MESGFLDEQSGLVKGDNRKALKEDSMLRMIFVVALMLSLFAVASTAQFTEWSTPVNLGPAINTT